MKKLPYLVISFLIFFSFAYSQVDTTLSDDEKIINLIGGRLHKVFSSFGCPVDVTSLGLENNFDVVLDYTKFGFRISNKTVIICYFWKDYDKSIRGIKIGDPKSTLVEKWGTPTKSKTSTKGEPILIWDIKELDASLIAWLDEKDVVKRISVELK